MNITVRLYKLHDYDLVYLNRILQFPIKEAMKTALCAYVRNEPVFFKIPVKEQNEETELEEMAIKLVQFHIVLSEEDDQDVIRYLLNIKKKCRNSFLKNLLRGYLAGSAAYVYENGNDLDTTILRQETLEDSILNIQELTPLKKRKKRKNYVILTTDQKQLLDGTGAFDNVEVIISDRNTSEN